MEKLSRNEGNDPRNEETAYRMGTIFAGYFLGRKAYLGYIRNTVPGVMMCACDPSTWEAEAGGSL